MSILVKPPTPEQTQCSDTRTAYDKATPARSWRMKTIVAAGLRDAATARPAATYPQVLFLDHSYNPQLNRHLYPTIAAAWDPPTVWVCQK